MYIVCMYAHNAGGMHVRMFVTPREQRTHDLEHRARYKALRERWEVLDRLVAPQDSSSMSEQLEFYLELSDDEACDMHTNQLHVQLKKNMKVVCVCVCVCVCDIVCVILCVCVCVCVILCV